MHHLNHQKVAGASFDTAKAHLVQDVDHESQKCQAHSLILSPQNRQKLSFGHTFLLGDLHALKEEIDLLEILTRRDQIFGFGEAPVCNKTGYEG